MSDDSDLQSVDAGDTQESIAQSVDEPTTVTPAQSVDGTSTNGTQESFECDACGHTCSNKYVLNRHRKQYCKSQGTVPMQHECDACERTFSDKYALRRHRKNNCKVLKESALQTQKGKGGALVHSDLRKNVVERFPVLATISDGSVEDPFSQLVNRLTGVFDRRLEEKVGELRNKESGSDKLIPCSEDKKDGDKKDGDKKDEEKKIDIVCLAKGDYVKKVIEVYGGDEKKAMEYIKNVGTATDFIESDFLMIKKVYFDGKLKSQFPIRIKDFSRKKIEYLEENGEWIVDVRGEIVGKRLCDNIVKTLLIANNQFNDVIINEPDEDRKAVLFDLFQINKTQAHIMKLLERKTQGKMIHRVVDFIHYCAEVQKETGSLDNVKKAYEG